MLIEVFNVLQDYFSILIDIKNKNKNEYLFVPLVHTLNLNEK